MRRQLRITGLLLAACASTAYADKPLTEVFFGFDSDDLDMQSKVALDAAAQRAAADPGAKLVLQGHADPRGTSPYNVALSIRRAEAAANYLVDRGVDRNNIVMAYYGEDGARRATFAQDRRVSVELTRSPLFVIIDKSLPTATAVKWEKPATVAEIEGPRAEQTARR